MLIKKIALAFILMFSVATVGCQNFGTITPEKAIAHALAANKVVAQCYADYQKELDQFTADKILRDNHLEPVGVVPIPTN